MSLSSVIKTLVQFPSKFEKLQTVTYTLSMKSGKDPKNVLNYRTIKYQNTLPFAITVQHCFNIWSHLSRNLITFRYYPLRCVHLLESSSPRPCVCKVCSGIPVPKPYVFLVLEMQLIYTGLKTWQSQDNSKAISNISTFYLSCPQRTASMEYAGRRWIGEHGV